MKKIAFFVEGQSERIFIEHFLNDYLAPTDFKIDSYRIVAKNLISISKGLDYKNPSYMFLIYDVGNDERVASAIRERAPKLFEDGFHAVIGVRDLHPQTIDMLEDIKQAFNSIFISFLHKDKIHLSIPVTEIEAWFLADYKLYERLDSQLTSENINNRLSVDIVNDNIEDYRNPATQIDKIFKIIDRSYSKHEHETYSICSRIDFCELCFEESCYSRIQRFKEFFELFKSII